MELKSYNHFYFDGWVCKSGDRPACCLFWLLYFRSCLDSCVVILKYFISFVVYQYGMTESLFWRTSKMIWILYHHFWVKLLVFILQKQRESMLMFFRGDNYQWIEIFTTVGLTEGLNSESFNTMLSNALNGRPRIEFLLGILTLPNNYSLWLYVTAVCSI